MITMSRDRSVLVYLQCSELCLTDTLGYEIPFCCSVRVTSDESCDRFRYSG